MFQFNVIVNVVRLERLLPSEFGPQEIPLDTDDNFVVLNGNATLDIPGMHLTNFRHVSYRAHANGSARPGAVLEDSV